MQSSKIEFTEVKQYLEWMSDMCESSLRLEISDFSLTPECLKDMTGLTWDNIEVLRELVSSIKNSSTRNFSASYCDLYV